MNTQDKSSKDTSDSVSKDNSSLEEKAAKIVEIIHSDKSEEEKSNSIWEIIK